MAKAISAPKGSKVYALPDLNSDDVDGCIQHLRALVDTVEYYAHRGEAGGASSYVGSGA